MKRRQFVKSAVALSAMTLGLQAQKPDQKGEGKAIYELRQYTLTWGGRQKALDDYLSKALIPTLNRLGVSPVGVFTERGNPEPAKCHVLIPYVDMHAYADTHRALGSDAEFKKLGAEFNNLPPDRKIYTRYDTSMLLAFDRLPQLEKPASEKRIFEIRTYEGYNEDAVRRKTLMFNKEEIDLFYKTKLNPVIFGEMISGPNMPALTYMLWFKDYEERDKNWEGFIAHDEWKVMSGREEYANSVSKIIRIFLEPRDYSQI